MLVIVNLQNFKIKIIFEFEKSVKEDELMNLQNIKQAIIKTSR